MRYQTEHFVNDAAAEVQDMAVPVVPGVQGPGDAELERLDLLLARAVDQRAPGPPGAPARLADQIFGATVGLLASQRAGAGRGTSWTSDRRPGTARMPSVRSPLHRRWWSRVSLGVAVLLAFAAAVNVFQAGVTPLLSSNALLAMSIVSGGDDQVAGFFGSAGQAGSIATRDSLGSLSGSIFRDASFETFGIFGARVDDLLGELSDDDFLGG